MSKYLEDPKKMNRKELIKHVHALEKHIESMQRLMGTLNHSRIMNEMIISQLTKKEHKQGTKVVISPYFDTTKQQEEPYAIFDASTHELIKNGFLNEMWARIHCEYSGYIIVKEK